MNLIQKEHHAKFWNIIRIVRSIQKPCKHVEACSLALVTNSEFKPGPPSLGRDVGRSGERESDCQTCPPSPSPQENDDGDMHLR